MKIHARHTCANIAHVPAEANHAVIVRCVASGVGARFIAQWKLDFSEL